MVLCGTWSETSVAQSQFTQFWQIPRNRTLSYSLWTPCFVSHDYPLAVEPGSTPRPLLQKKTWRDSLPIDMLLSAVPVLVVAQSSSEIPEGLVNNPVHAATYRTFRPPTPFELQFCRRVRNNSENQPLASSCLSARTKELRSQWTHFNEIW